MAKTGVLNINFETNVAKIVNDFQRVGREVGKTSKNISASLDFIKKAAGAYISVQALRMGASFVHQQMEMIDANSKLANSLGVTTAAVADMSLVFDEAGAGAESLPKALTALQNALMGAAQGSKIQADAFKLLNLNTRELFNLSPDEQFNKVATALSGIDNATLKVGVASDIFGAKLGQKLLPMMGKYAETMKDAEEFNKKFGRSVNEIDSAKVEEANDSFGRISKSIEGIAGKIGVELSPIITGMSKDWIEAADGADVWANRTSSAINFVAEQLDALHLAIDIVKDGWVKNIADKVVSEGTQFVATISGEGDLAAIIKKETDQTVSQRLDDIWGRLQNGDKTFTSKLDEYRTASQANAESVVADNNRIKDAMGGVDAALDKMTKKMKDTSWAGGVTRALADLDKNLGDVSVISEKLVKDSFTNLEDAFVSLAKTGKLSMSDMVDSILSDLTRLMVRQSITQPLFNAFSGSSLSSIIGNIGSLLPSFDVGTPYVPHDMVASIHKGERILTAEENKSYGTGGDVSITVINNSGAKVSARQQASGQGQRALVLQIDDVVGGLLKDPSSQSSQAAMRLGTLTSR